MEDRGVGRKEQGGAKIKLFFKELEHAPKLLFFGASTSAFLRHKDLLLSSWEGWDSSPLDCVLWAASDFQTFLMSVDIALL